MTFEFDFLNVYGHNFSSQRIESRSQRLWVSIDWRP